MQLEEFGLACEWKAKAAHRHLPFTGFPSLLARSLKTVTIFYLTFTLTSFYIRKLIKIVEQLIAF